MTTRQFNQSVNAEIKRMLNKAKSDQEFNKAKDYWRIRDGHTDAINKAQQGATSFSEWLDKTGDSIDIGGNEIPDRVQANHDIYKNGNPFQQ